jgi:hypothetical protein
MALSPHVADCILVGYSDGSVSLHVASLVAAPAFTITQGSSSVDVVPVGVAWHPVRASIFYVMYSDNSLHTFDLLASGRNPSQPSASSTVQLPSSKSASAISLHPIIAHGRPFLSIGFDVGFVLVVPIDSQAVDSLQTLRSTEAVIDRFVATHEELRLTIVS